MMMTISGGRSQRFDLQEMAIAALSPELLLLAEELRLFGLRTLLRRRIMVGIALNEAPIDPPAHGLDGRPQA